MSELNDKEKNILIYLGEQQEKGNVPKREDIIREVPKVTEGNFDELMKSLKDKGYVEQPKSVEEVAAEERQLDEISHTLGKLSEEGKLKEEYDEETGDFKYSFTEEGLNYSGEMLKNNRDARLFMFSVFMNMAPEGQDPLETLVNYAKFMKKECEVNAFREVAEAVERGEIKGIEIKKDNLEELNKLYERL